LAQVVDSYRAIGSILRNMGLSILLSFIAPVIGLWSLYLALQLILATRNAAREHNNPRFRVMGSLAIGIFTNEVILLVSEIVTWIVYSVDTIVLSHNSFSSSSPMYLFLVIAGSIGIFFACVISCLGIGFWAKMNDFFRSDVVGSMREKGLKGSKATILGYALGLLTAIFFILVLLGYWYMNQASSTTLYPPLSSQQISIPVLAFNISLIVAGIHLFLAIAFMVTGYFKTGSVFHELGSTASTGSISPISIPRISAQIPITPAQSVNNVGVEATRPSDRVMSRVQAQGAPEIVSGEAPLLVSDETTARLGSQSPELPHPDRCPRCGNMWLIDPDFGTCEYCGEKIW